MFICLPDNKFILNTFDFIFYIHETLKQQIDIKQYLKNMLSKLHLESGSLTRQLIDKSIT